MAQRNPWQLPGSIQELSQEVDHLFDELIHQRWRGVQRPAAEAWTPQLDLYETASAFILEADLPGVKEKDIAVRIEDGNLVLQGTRTVEHVSKSDSFFYQERRSGHFRRQLRLPISVDQDAIAVKFQEGVLYVTLPKKQERP